MTPGTAVPGALGPVRKGHQEKDPNLAEKKAPRRGRGDREKRAGLRQQVSPRSRPSPPVGLLTTLSPDHGDLVYTVTSSTDGWLLVVGRVDVRGTLNSPGGGGGGGGGADGSPLTPYRHVYPGTHFQRADPNLSMLPPILRHPAPIRIWSAPRPPAFKMLASRRSCQALMGALLGAVLVGQIGACESPAFLGMASLAIAPSPPPTEVLLLLPAPPSLPFPNFNFPELLNGPTSRPGPDNAAVGSGGTCECDAGFACATCHAGGNCNSTATWGCNGGAVWSFSAVSNLGNSLVGVPSNGPSNGHRAPVPVTTAQFSFWANPSRCAPTTASWHPLPRNLANAAACLASPTTRADPRTEKPPTIVMVMVMVMW